MFVPCRVLHENILENTVHFDSNYIVAVFLLSSSRIRQHLFSIRIMEDGIER